jgi:nonribosomal peptide synthetase DhbF
MERLSTSALISQAPTPLPLSVAQSEVWFAQQLSPDAPVYNIGGYVEISGAVDRAVMERAIHEVLVQADSYRYRFQNSDDGPRQIVGVQTHTELRLVDFSSGADPGAQALAWMREQTEQPFDLTLGPLCRISLLKVSSAHFFCFGVFHHIVTDFFGTILLLRCVAERYAAATTATAIAPLNLPPWAQILAGEDEYRASTRCVRDRDYWLAQLHDRPQTVTLSGRPPSWPTATIRSEAAIAGSTFGQLQALAATCNTGVVAVLFAAIALYLSRVTGAGDLVLGMPVSGRTDPKRRASTGFLANVVPLRLKVEAADSFVTLVQHAATRIREAFRHQRYGSGALRLDLGLAANEPNPYGPILNFLPSDAAFDFGGCSGRPHVFSTSRNVEDLAVTVHAGNDGSDVMLELGANAAHYDEGSLQAHERNILRLLELVSEHAEESTGALARRLPQYLIPEVVTPSAALPCASGADAQSASYEPPRTPTERRLAAIWCEVLRCDRVGLSDDFFHSGGHSLLALKVIARVRECFGRELSLKTLFDAPRLDLLAAALERSPAASVGLPATPTVVAQEAAAAPLSHSQERMWLIQSLNPQTIAYNLGGTLWIDGALDVAALSRSFDDLIARHEVLRSRIQIIDEQPHQIVEPLGRDALEVLDLRQYPDPEAEATQRVIGESRVVFDLAHDRVIRTKLFQIAADRFLLSIVIHHVAADQWSMGVFGRELAALYNCRVQGRQVQLPPLPLTYRDFARWQRSVAFTDRFDRQLQFWTRQLANLPTVDLPVDHVRPKFWTTNGASCQRQIPTALFNSIQEFARRSGATVFMTLFAGFVVLLHRLTGQTDLPIGVPVANRGHSAVEGIIGTFVNTLVLRTDLQGDPEFGKLLERVRANALEAFQNQDVSFDRLVQELGQRDDRSRPPLVQVMFNVANAPMDSIEFGALKWSPLFFDRGGAQFELSFAIDTEITRTLSVEYNTDLFEPATIERLIGQYFTILDAVVRSPQRRLSSLPLLPVEQLSQLREWNASPQALPQALAFPRLFEAQAAKSPGAVAISFEDDVMSYGELNARSNQFARLITSAGVTRGAKVGVCVPRSPLLLVALLAVQKSGAAYVPLDPGFPAERLRYMLSDSGTLVVVKAGPLPPGLEVPAGIQVLDITDLPGNSDPNSGQNLSHGPGPKDLAYLLYTSGSTGRPKGVSVSHGALANLLVSMRERPGICASDVLAAVTTISFDIAALELYLPLIAGARVELVSREVATDGQMLAQHLDFSGATLLQATPATWRMLMEVGWHPGRQFRALCGGEALSRKLADEILQRVDELWNMYGPTETTIWSTIDKVGRADSAISIGRPISNTQVYVLDSTGEIVPIGVVGEICIGGAGVADGYHGQPELTAERFIPDPFAAAAGGHLYKTGDLGRWAENGKLYHLGRSDDQVKIRGYRIELGEVEKVLGAHPAIQQVIVAVREARADDPRLVAFVRYCAGEEATVGDLKRELRIHLPDYMMPSIIVPMDSMPLTPNGKVDRAALPNPFAGSLIETTRNEPPATQMEQRLAEIWRAVLNIERVTALDNFFELGGYSLLSLRVANMVQAHTGKRLDPRTLFFQNLREIAAGIELQGAQVRGIAR